ncbi:hypothetical protein KC930_00375 [Candidatus Saccharibacteria bacterium]|nr:hypothetical protein [Candidatus Saccharibacteria bacterium]
MKKLLIFFASFLTMAAIGQTLAFSAQASNSTNINVQTIPGSTVTEQVASNVKRSWPWYVSRGSGLLAAVSLVILMLSGIGQITGDTFRFLDPITSWASHRSLGIVFGGSIIAHVFSLLFDHYLKFTILDIFVPWHSKFQEASLFGFKIGSAYLAFGIVAFYLSMLVVVSSLIWITSKAKLWKLIHLMSYVVILLIFFHAVMIGTDLSHGWAKIVWYVLGATILVGSIVRGWRSFTA